MDLKLQDVFHSVVDYRWASATKHHLVGIVTYYGKHYSTFFFHTKLRVWIYFDDATVHEIGPKWEQVIEKCRRGHFQPLLLLYANPNGSPISNATAPKSVTLVGGNKVTVEVSDSSNSTGNKSGMVYFEDDNHRRTTVPRAQKQKSHILNECGSLGNSGKPSLLYNSGSVSHPLMSGHCSFEGVHQQLFERYPSYPKCDSNAQCCIDTNTLFQPDLGQQYGGQWHSCITPSADLKQKIGHPLMSSNSSETLSVDHIDKSNGRNPTLCSQPLHLHSPGESLRVPDPRQLSLDSASQQETNPEGAENSEDHSTYISRKAVQSVLTAQKLQRQRSLNGSYYPSVRNRNSSSSLESFDNKDKTLNNLPGLRIEIGKAANVPRRRDSGNWSGDRNSASSASSTSLDSPFFYVVGNKKPGVTAGSLRNIEYEMRSGQQDCMNMGALSDKGYDSFSLSSTDSYPSVTGSPAKIDPRLIKISEDLQDSYPPVAGLPAKVDPRLIQIPEDLQDSHPPVAGLTAKIDPRLMKIPEDLRDSYTPVAGLPAKVDPRLIQIPEDLRDSYPSVTGSPAKIDPRLIQIPEDLQDSYLPVAGLPAKINPRLIQIPEDLQDSYPPVAGLPAKIDPRLIQIPEDLQTVFQLTGILKPNAPELQSLIESNNSKTKGEDCEKLCAEADLLLVKSHEKENEGDLVVAAVLAESAAAKARAAMDSPYNNPQSLVSAKIKHSFCVMRSSSLHKRLKEAEMEERRRQKEFTVLEGHHSRQSSRDSTHGRHSRQGIKEGSSGSHSRQGSKDGSLGSHSRQGSKDGSSGSHSRQGSKDSSNGKQIMAEFDVKAFELNATLPKKVSKQKGPNNNLVVSPEGSQARKEKQLCKTETYCQGPNQEKAPTGPKPRIRNTEFYTEKFPELKDQSGNSIVTARSDENDCTKDLNFIKEVYFEQNVSDSSLPKAETLGKPDGTLMQFNEQSNKKQHKIRKKLMGGLARRKNRSLPDLREGQDQSDSTSHSFDDSLILQTPLSSKSLDYKLSKNVNRPSDSKISHVTKGCHQPHLAFIKRNSQQQRSLVKVSPPHVGMVVSQPPKDKSGSFDKICYDFPPPPLDHMLLIHSPDVLTQFIEPPPPALHADPSCLSISVPTGERSCSTTQHQQVPVHLQPEVLQKEPNTAPLHILEGNAGIQVTKEQLLKERVEREKNTEGMSFNSERRIDGSQNHKSVESLIGSQNHKSVRSLGGFTNPRTSSQLRRENEWLEELETKQFQILRKRNHFHEKTPITEIETRNSGQSLIQKQTEVENNQKKIGQLENNQNNIHSASEIPQSTSVVKASVVMFPSRNTIDEDKGNRCATDERKSCSVKDLASRFEFVLKPRKGPITSLISNNALTQRIFEPQKNENSVSIKSKSSLIERCSSDQTSGKKYEINNDNIHEMKQIIPENHPSNDTSISTPHNFQWVSNAVTNERSHNDTSFGSLSDNHSPNCHPSLEPKRPECPPDYETAIQRIEILKDCIQLQTVDAEQNYIHPTQSFKALSSNDQQYNTLDTHPTQSFTTLSPSDQQYNTLDTHPTQSFTTLSPNDQQYNTLDTHPTQSFTTLLPSNQQYNIYNTHYTQSFPALSSSDHQYNTFNTPSTQSFPALSSSDYQYNTFNTHSTQSFPALSSSDHQYNTFNTPSTQSFPALSSSDHQHQPFNTPSTQIFPALSSSDHQHSTFNTHSTQIFPALSSSDHQYDAANADSS
ncbi:uncharacterized protein LOC106476222 isoform X4 [Limulus polyphemus]|uniref:Uncharacterized protein LOC106476222 isoform X3 n=1 Tax=Limulus polyphemus TaxID=6850 RepID=A0ABM1RWV7_LIMPO|nr:uncharacterized protein LOC106476222 isoform X3 [Limulus polyphemus]XP_022235863.1 uncharacterized protein LOC106476222 isoform X4 [Limulus polyphemus]